jgi:hypothetical protein
MAVAIVLRLILRDRPVSRRLRVVWMVALLVAVVAFVDGMRYECCVDPAPSAQSSAGPS